MFVAVAAATLSGCSKDPSVDAPTEVPKKVSLRIIPTPDQEESSDKNKANTRTEFGENYQINWLNDDVIGVYINSASPTTNAEGIVDRDQTTSVVSFIAEVSAFAANDVLCTYYPYSNSNDGKASTEISLSIPADQQQSAINKFNGSTNPLVGNPQVFEIGSADQIISQQIKFYILGAMAEVGISTTNSEYQGEIIRSLSFVNSTSENIAGTFPYDITATAGAIASAPIDKAKLTNGSNSVTVSLPETSTAKPSATATESCLYLTFIPGTYTGDFVLVTDKATYMLKDKTLEFPRAFVKRLIFNLDKAGVVRIPRIEGAAKWEANKDDLSTNSSTPKAFVTLGTPALTWAQTTINPYFSWDATKGIQIGSGSNQATEILTTNGYADQIKSIVINASTASNGDAGLSVYLDDKLIRTDALTSTATDYTFSPATPTRASSIKIEMKSNTQKAMYLKSITILPSNIVLTPLATPTLAVNGTVISWEAVSGATGYQYTTNTGISTLPIASNTSLDCTAWEPGTYSVQVRALGDNLITSDSEWSEVAAVTIEAPAEDDAYELITNASQLSVGSSIIITSGTSGAVKAISTTQNANNRAEAEIAIAASGKITAIPAAVQILELQAGTKVGTYAFYDAATPGYLAAVVGSSNYLRTDNSASDNASWSISIASNAATITAQGDASRKLLKYNTSSKLFSCYASGQGEVYIFQKVDLTPRIVVDGTYNPLAIAYNTMSGSIPFTAKNLTGSVTATVTNGNWFSATAASDKVDWTATANTGEARTATLTLSADGAESVVISVSQAAAPVALTAPANLAVAVDKLTATATWTANTNASSYAWRLVAGGSDVQSGTATTASVVLSGLSASTSYAFYVKAIGDGSAYLDSTESNKSFATEAVVIPQLTMSDITVGSATASSLVASWTTVANATGYKYKVTKTSDGTEIKAETAETGTSVTVTGLTPETEYTISVLATGNGVDYLDSPYKSANGTTTEGTAEQEYSFSIVATDFSTVSYADNNRSHSKPAPWDSNATVSYYSNQIMQQSSVMQWQKSASYLYNETNLGKITSVVVTSTANFLTVYESDTVNSTTTKITPTTSGSTSTYTCSGNNGFIKITCGGTLSKVSNITINFKK